MSHVIVIGAGITGLATAHALAGDGIAVTLVDAYGPAAMASGWTLAGVRQSGRDPAELPLAREAVALWATLDEELDAPTGYRRSGNLRLARDAQEAKRIAALVEEQSAAGLEISLVEGSDLRALAPALSPDIVCASHCPSDGQAEPLAVAQAYRDAGERLGVRFRFGTRVTGIDCAGGRFRAIGTADGPIAGDACLVAAGIGTPGLLAPLGLDLPLRTPLVTVALSEKVAPCLDQVLGTASANVAARQQTDGRLRVSSGILPWDGHLTHDDQGHPRANPDAATLSAMLMRVAQVLPAFATMPIERFWGGVIDLTPDALPVLGPVPGIEGLHVASGFSGHGFCLGPVTGRIMRDLLLGREQERDLAAFAFARFGEGAQAAAPLTLHG